jgi:N utilization substance protein B
MALKALYQIAIGGMEPSAAMESVFDENAPRGAEGTAALAWEAMRDYARALVDGVLAHGEEYDAILARYARDWDPDRMPTVDHILLHIGLQELLHAPDVPPGVAINEAVALAKEYSTEESGKFVNGILGAWSRAEGPEKKK